jgi:DNA-directed RNA polymerase subunit omega
MVAGVSFLLNFRLEGFEIMAKVFEESIEQEGAMETPEMDSKYRMIIVAAKRSKQLQRGARPRVEMDAQKHKPTRIALEEVMRGKVDFTITPRD